MKPRAAVIDLGTNTFHLCIAEQTGPGIRMLHSEKTGVRLGEQGINQGIITDAAQERALSTLKGYLPTLSTFGIEPGQVFAAGTSALRNALNGPEFCSRVFKETGLAIQIIAGEMEAAYIYEGVKACGALNQSQQALIMDIGGGSVEFIIGNASGYVFKQSFETGAIRLRELFVNTDPVSPHDMAELERHLMEVLIPLFEAAAEYKPVVLVGSSGTFDTLYAVQAHKQEGPFDYKSGNCYPLSLTDYKHIAAELLIKNRAERLATPGMIPLRVDLVVPALCLINCVLEQIPQLTEITISTYALKEGIIYSLFKD